MATSGTVATTVLDTAVLIEHAFRRVRVTPEKQTPELVSVAQDNLYLLLLGLSSTGLNLWCIETVLLGLVEGQPLYVMPAGTLEVLNLVYSVPQLETSAFTSITDGGKASITSTAVMRLGFQPTTDFTGALTIASSPDDVSYTTLKTVASAAYTAGLWYWVDLPVTTTAAWFKITGTGLALTDIRVASSVRDLPVNQWSRDTYSVINDKRQEGSPSTCYYLEKRLTPQVTLWPVPNDDQNHLTVFIHRQVQDIGTLTQQIEVPQRWVEAIIWQLALRLAFEIDKVDPAIISSVKEMANETYGIAELTEADGAPIRLAPNIGGYTA